MFPVNPAFNVSHLTLEFNDKVVESVVEERKKVEIKYDDAVASGTAMPVMASYDKTLKDMMRLNIGNFPPKQSCVIVLHLTHLLTIEDASWSLRLPMCYIPRYTLHHDIQEAINQVTEQQNQPTIAKSDLFISRIAEVASIPCTKDWGNMPYKWSVCVKVIANEALTRVVSKSHNITPVMSPDN